MQTPALRILSPICCSWTLVLKTSGVLPVWKGSLMRGLIGWGLADVAAGAPAQPWPGCRGRFADAVMDPQQAWSDPLAQVPWALQCDDIRERFQAGETISCQAILLGGWLPWAVDLFRAAVEAGVDRGVGHLRLQGEIVDWKQSAIELVDNVTGFSPTSVRLNMRTPGRFKHERASLRHLHPPAIVKGLVRRWRQLAKQCVGKDPLTRDLAQSIAHSADALVRLAGEDRPVDLARYSNRQERVHGMDAVGGWCDIGGPSLPSLWPWLRMAPILHVGRQPCFGLGWAELTCNMSCTQNRLDPGTLPRSADFSPPIQAD